MKTKFIFIFIFSSMLNAIAVAQKGNVSNSIRTQFYNVGIKASIVYYDSLILHCFTERNQKKIDESEFLKLYEQIEVQYRNQEQHICQLAQKWSLLLDEKNNKNIRASLLLLAKDKIVEARELLKSKLARKKVTDKTINEFKLLSELYSFSGNYPLALSSYLPIINNATVNALDLSEYAMLLSSNNQDSLAIVFIDKSSSLLPNDTFFLVENKIRLNDIYQHQKATNYAKGALIEAQYLIENVSEKTRAQQLLLAKVLTLISDNQTNVNDFDNAIVNSKNSLSIYNKLREGDIENDVVVDEARAFNTIAALYKKAGGQREADTFYQKVIKVYQLLASTYPESFTPILAQAMTEYAELQKWFDRDARYDSLLHVVIALREKISKSAYPFSKLAYAESLGRLAQKISNFDMKIFLAEEQWQKEKDLLTPIAPAHLLILGNEYCTTLSKLGGVKIALKNTDEAIPFFAQSLAFREQSFRLAPLNNKRAMLDLLTQNATLNALNKKYEIAVEQLARAKVYADDLGDDKYAKQIADYRNEILRK